MTETLTQIANERGYEVPKSLEEAESREELAKINLSAGLRLDFSSEEIDELLTRANLYSRFVEVYKEM